MAQAFRRCLPFIVLLALLAILYPEPMFQGKIYGTADATAADAFRQVGDSAREDAVYPLWNPYLFLGMPSFGSLAYTVGVYPPTVVFEGLHRLGLPPLTWLLGHLLFGGLGMWWLLGRWRTPWAARLLGCIAWLWFARIVAWGVYGHGSKLGAAMYMPWLLGLTWQVLTRGSLRATALAGLLLGLQFLRGHVQISYYTLLLLGFLTVWSLIWPLVSGARPAMGVRWRRAGLMVVVLAVGFSIGAALLLPVHEYAEISTRGAGGASGGSGTAFDYATSWSLAPEDLGALLLPAAAGFGKATYLGRMPFTDYPNYFGPLLLVLAAAAWFSGRRSLTLGLGAGSLLALLLAAGRFSPGLYQVCYEVLPYFDKFRVPSMIMVLPALALAVLAGLGATALADPTVTRAQSLKRLAWGLLAVGGVALLAGMAGFGQGAYRETLTRLAAGGGKQAASVILDAAWNLHRALLVRQGLVLAAAGGAMLLAARKPAFRVMWLVPVLALLLLVDLGSVARLVTHPERSLVDVVRDADGRGRLAPASRLVRTWQGPARAQVEPQVADALRDMVGHGRLFPLGSDATTNAYMTAGVRSLGGYHPAKPAADEAVRRRLFGRTPAGHLARWLSATAVSYPGVFSEDILAMLRDSGLELESPGQRAGRAMLYRVRDPLPRARLVDRWRLVTMLPEGDALAPFLDAVADGTHDPTAETILDQEPQPAPQTGQEALPEPVFVADGVNEVVLRVATPRPALLLLADLAAPGWEVDIDDEPATLLRADLILRAVALPEGDHEVRFHYHDPALQWGLALALTGVLGVLILLVVSWRRDRFQVAAVADGDMSERHGDER